MALPLTLSPWIASAPLDARADNTITFSSPRLSGSGADTPLGTGILSLGAAPAAPASSSPGVPCLEILQGNGTGAGYVLSHGNILSQTVSVHAGGGMLLPDRDYWLDSLNGTLFFARPMQTSDRISVSYRYVEGQDGQRQPLGVPALQFGIGHATMAGLFYGMTSGNGSGFDVSTYGLALNSHFGADGLSTYTGLTYFSHSQRSASVVANLRPSGLDAKTPPKTDPGSDHLIVQNVSAHSGAWQAHAGYQDVGKQFAGFSALKLSYAGNQPMLDQLTQLEGEKGVKRLGFGFAYQPVSESGGGVPGGLAFDWSQIRDGKGAITQQSAGYHSRAFHVDYSTLDIGQAFTQFSGLREAEHDQWAKEKGIRSQELGLGFNFALGGKGQIPGAPQTGGLEFVSQRFADKGGGLQRTVWSLDAGRLHFLGMNRRGDAAFNRLGDLADKDKAALALDLYRQYDPRASAEQVTAADKAQVARETGLSRSALAAEVALGRSGSLAFSDLHVDDATKKGADDAGFRRESFSLETPGLDLIYVRRQTGAGFRRLGDLADIEKSNLALDILHQFDPMATLSQVTQKQRDQAGAEAGLEREALGGRWQIGKVGVLAFGDFSIYDTPAGQAPRHDKNAIRRQSLSFFGRRLQLTWLQQSISDSFSRLTSLSDVERAQFGNEHGLDRQQLELAWQPNKTTKIGFSSLSVGSTPDAVAATLAAQKNGQDMQAAARAIAARMHRETFTLDTTGLSLAAHFADTGKGFARGADLAMPAADQNSVRAEEGYRRSDLALHFARLKGLTVDSYTYNAVDALDQLRHDTYKQNFQYTPGRGLQLAYTADGDVATADSKANGLVHSHLALDQSFGKGMQLSLYQDDSATYANGTVSKAAHIRDLHFQTAQNQPNALLFENQRITFQDGTFQNMVNVNVHAKPAREFAFNYTKQQIDSDAPNDPSANTDTLDFQWDAGKQMAMTGAVSQHESSDKQNSDTVSVGMKGQPIKDVAVDASFNEVHQNAKNTKDVADLGFSNPKPFTLGPIQELTLSARYAALNDQRKLQNETVTGRATWKLWKNEFLLDYGGLTPKYGQTTVTRTYSFLTDPNPKKWFHAGFLYKDRSLYTGEEQLIRRFTVDARLSKTLQFAYLFGTLPEDEKGNVTPQTTANVSLKNTILTGLSWEMFYRSQDNTATKILTRSLGLGFEGKVSRIGKLRFAYSLDANGTPTTYDHSHHFLLGYNQQIDADHLLNLSVEFRTHDSLGLTQEITTNLDFHTIF